MQTVNRLVRVGLIVLAMAGAQAARGQASETVGIFENHQDVGTVLHPGLASFDATAGKYTIAGSGANIWAAADAFQFVWKKASGDLSLAATIEFGGTAPEPHRKACLMIRKSLDADSAYVDVASHGNGLTALQFREAKGAATHEIESNLSGPKRLQIVKRGKYVTMFLGEPAGDLKFSGAAERITFEEPFYVGIGVCAHNKDATERAVFSEVELNTSLPAANTPKWSPDGRKIAFVTYQLVSQ